jgi:outer membrane protein OmpA-like peptidoglycan-associated protein
MLALLTALGLTGCSLFSVSYGRSDFTAVTVTAAPPAPPPARTVEKINISEKIMFETGKATLMKRSFAVLDEVAKVMQDRPGIKMVQIEGHTDSVGDADKNRKLSQDRADSVLAYLVKKGIDKARLTAKGHGPDKPVADNSTDAGREANRRVEFLITQQDEK